MPSRCGFPDFWEAKRSICSQKRGSALLWLPITPNNRNITRLSPICQTHSLPISHENRSETERFTTREGISIASQRNHATPAPFQRHRDTGHHHKAALPASPTTASRAPLPHARLLLLGKISTSVHHAILQGFAQSNTPPLQKMRKTALSYLRRQPSKRPPGSLF